MNKPGLIIGLSVIAIASLVALLLLGDKRPEPGSRLMIYCAAGIQAPMDAVVAQYEAAYGTSIQMQYAGSGTLLSNLQLEKRGDLYIAADSSYIDIAREKELVAEVLPIAYQKPVILVAKGNPKNIVGVQDLRREELRVSLANPEAASVGKLTKKLLEQAGLWEEVEANVQNNGVFKPTVNDIANDVKIGAVDAAIVWDATAMQYADLEMVSFPEGDASVEQVSCAVLQYSAQPTAALHFARYLNALDKGQQAFVQAGFAPAPGDAWAEVPEITYYAGGVNRVGVEATLAAFGKREGVKINTVYNGCGILLGQIKTGGRPDFYHTCDASFMKGVEPLFSAPLAITKTDIVIITPIKNKHNIERLEDLTQEGLQVGLCHEEQSTLGALTKKILQGQGLYDAVQKNVVVSTPTADMLVNQVDVGKLDAAIVYRANTTKVRDTCAVIPIPLPDALAVQTVAIAQETKFPNLMQRLQDALFAPESLARFEASGFEAAAH